jgi:hypothetical protein
MLKTFYERIVLAHPLKVLFFLSLFVVFFAFGATKLEIDASSNTLLLQNDSDLQFTRKVAKEFQTQDILLIAFSPKSYLLSQETLSAIDGISKELLALNKIDSVTSILNVPLLESSNKPIKELITDIPTLEKGTLDKELVKKEFLSSPLYTNNLVSKDFKTTAIVINLKEDKKYQELIKEKNKFKKDDTQLNKTLIKIKEHRDRERVLDHHFIKNIRSIIQNHNSDGKLFLGGVKMVADDLISFVKNDLRMYGSILFGLLVVILWIIFREIRWVVIPIIICCASILATSGILGFLGWEVTVVSSNFISLQLIITISIVLHLIVRYRELVLKHPEFSQHELVLETILSKANPSFYAILTTIVGFSSLIFSKILPIINLGWMMSSGIAMSLFIAFILFPAILVKLPISKPYTTFENNFTPTKFLANWVEHHGGKIIIGSVIVVIFNITGASQLIVENSFINYFKQDTEIYQGMKVIDQKLGGTTPLDLIVKFKDEKKPLQAKKKNTDDEFASFDNEFASSKDENQYWFTLNKMQKIMQIHDYLDSKPEIGNVQSLATLLKIGKISNNGKELDNFQLALLYNKLPSEFKKLIMDPYLNIDKNEIRFATRIVDSSPELRRDKLIKELNRELKKIIKPELASFRLSNLMILYNNMLQSLFESQILTLGLVFVLLFIMFLFMFKSLKLSIIAMISNIVPIGVIFGFMGWFNIPLDLMTITIAAISLGIGVDDTIHYIHRYKEEFQKDGDYIKSMHRCHNSIGFAMYYTSFVVMMGFSVLVLSNFLPTIYFGLLTVLVMFMVLLGALLLLPKLLIFVGQKSKGKFL